MKKRFLRLTLNIADVIIRINSEIDLGRFRDLHLIENFKSELKSPAHCQLFLKYGLPRLPKKRKLIFHPSRNWKLFKTDKAYYVEVGTPYRNGDPDEVIVLSLDYARGYVYKRHIGELFRYFLDQFLLINLLVRNKGFLLHACGVSWNGNGLVFCGTSGAGKSTLLRLFSSVVRKEDLLNDDRVAVRKCGLQWKAFGTPWHGEFPIVSSASAPLKALYFIKHSKKNYLKALSTEEVCRTLFQHSLLPFWDEEAIEKVFDNFKRLATEIPVYELGVVPDKRVIKFITSKL